MAEARNIETGTDHLLARVEDGVATLTFNRPERRNALSAGMFTGLERALIEAASADDIRCVVLTGAGGAFCAGGDVKGMAEGQGSGDSGGGRGVDGAVQRQRQWHRATSARLYELPKPVVASLPGAAAGAGLALALACDLRIAAESAVLLTAFANVGFSGDFGGTFFLTQLVGSAKARELYYLSERIDAREAERIGLVNRVVAAEKLEAETRELAARLAHGPSVAYGYMKENLNRAVGGELYECLDAEATHHVHTAFTEDHRNAVKAFVEKRTPVFRGR
jgi:2-(1,2-epoxy-1,2-dihydrophenyl)acetyl-CoA isomerase